MHNHHDSPHCEDITLEEGSILLESRVIVVQLRDVYPEESMMIQVNRRTLHNSGYVDLHECYTHQHHERSYSKLKGGIHLVAQEECGGPTLLACPA